MTPLPEFDRLWAEARDCHGRGDAEGALLALYRALALRRDDLDCQQFLCRILFESPTAFVPGPSAASERDPGLVSVVVCSIDPAKFARVRASYAQAFGAAPWELVGIHDARSLAEGYTRGLARARGGIVVFSHDDIEILSPGLAGELGRALDAVDVVGVVGATRLAGPAFAWGGKAFTRGQIAEPAPGGGVQLVVFNPSPGITAGLAAVDGVFMAARRETVAAVGFDAASFDGFHLYDIDFSYRAHRAGYRVGVSAGILLRHDSPGGFDARWEEYARRFLAKFPEVRGERVQNVMPRIPFRSADELLAYCRRLDEAGRRAFGA
jgi:hypothetical protein